LLTTVRVLRDSPTFVPPNQNYFWSHCRRTCISVTQRSGRTFFLRPHIITKQQEHHRFLKLPFWKCFCRSGWNCLPPLFLLYSLVILLPHSHGLERLSHELFPASGKGPVFPVWLLLDLAPLLPNFAPFPLSNDYLLFLVLPTRFRIPRELF